MAIDRKEAVRKLEHPRAEAFEFAVLDTLKPSEEQASDPSDDLAVLEAMWRDKLSASGELYD